MKIIDFNEWKKKNAEPKDYHFKIGNSIEDLSDLEFRQFVGILVNSFNSSMDQTLFLTEQIAEIHKIFEQVYLNQSDLKENQDAILKGLIEVTKNLNTQIALNTKNTRGY